MMLRASAETVRSTVHIRQTASSQEVVHTPFNSMTAATCFSRKSHRPWWQSVGITRYGWSVTTRYS